MKGLWEQAKQQEAADLAMARPHPLWATAVQFLREHLSADVQAQIREAIPTEAWPAAYHTFWGMGIRNALREAGYGEGPFGIANLDNIYVELVEAAVKEKETHDER